MLSVMRVTGESLSPFLKHGDYILVGGLPCLLRRLKPGDIIVFRHPFYGVMVKRIESISSDGGELFVIGDHPDSTDSRAFGPIARRIVLGKALACFRR